MKNASKRSRNFNRSVFFAISPLVLIISATLSSASYAAESDDNNLETQNSAKNKTTDNNVIVVTGITSSLKEAQGIKKDADNILDALVAEDIGKFPDENVAEALQRIPGISVTRLNGEGQTVTIRGLSGDFNITGFNGRKLASDNASRDFNYDVIASELVGKIEVHKTQQARLTEGAVGGIINVFTRKPLDLGSAGSISIKADYNERAESTNPKTSIIVSDVFLDGSLGALVSLVHSKATSRYDVYGSTNWDDWEYSEVRLDPSLIPEGGDISDRFRMPNFPRITSTRAERERVGGTFALQWLPTENLDLNFDALYSSYDIDVRSKALSVVMPNIYSADGQYTGFNVGSDGFLSNASWDNATLELLETGVPRKSETYQVGFNANWLFNNELTFDFDLSASEAENLDDGDSSLVVVRAGIDGAAINFDNGQAIPDIILSQNLDENAAYGGHHTRKFGDTINDKNSRFAFDGTYEPNSGILRTIYFGAGYTTQEKDKKNYYPSSPSIFAQDHFSEVNPTYAAETVVIGGQTMWRLPSGVIIPGGSDNFGGGANIPTTWPSIDEARLFEFFQQLDPVAYQGLLPQLQASGGNSYTVKEETAHAYLEAKIEDEMFGLPYMFDFGVRYIKTDVTSSGYSQDPANLVFNSDGTLANDDWKERTLANFKGNYSEFLPSINFKLNLTDDFIFRFAASKSIARPFLSQLRPITSISPELDPGNGGKDQRTIFENDPGLSPYTSNQFDTTFEWYYSDNGNLAFATFFKEFSGFVKNEETTEMIAGQEFLVTRPYNDNENHSLIRGYELSWYQTFDSLLPEYLAGLGIAANISYNDSVSGEKDSEGEEIPFFGLSKNQSNLNLFYENDDVSVNLAYNRRSSYSAYRVSHWTYETFGSVDTEQAISPTWDSLSVSMSYDITDNLRITADANNLLDPDETRTVNALKTELLTAGVNDAEYTFGTASYGRRYSLGIRYKF